MVSNGVAVKLANWIKAGDLHVVGLFPCWAYLPPMCHALTLRSSRSSPISISQQSASPPVWKGISDALL